MSVGWNHLFAVYFFYNIWRGSMKLLSTFNHFVPSPPLHKKFPFLYNKLSWTINNDMKIGKLHTLTPQLHGNEMFIMMENWANCKNNVIQQDKSSSIIKFSILLISTLWWSVIKLFKAWTKDFNFVCESSTF